MSSDIDNFKVIDYLCNQTDRHEKNVFFIFDDINADQPKLKSVQGIDNDRSFGIGFMPAEKIVTVITEEMKDKITKLNKDEFSEVLKNSGIEQKEIDDAISRLNDLKKKIEEKKIAVVSNDEWGTKYTIDSELFPRKSPSVTALFSLVAVAKGNVIIIDDSEEGISEGKNDDIFLLAEKVDDFSLDAQNKAKLNALAEKEKERFVGGLADTINNKGWNQRRAPDERIVGIGPGMAPKERIVARSL